MIENIEKATKEIMHRFPQKPEPLSELSQCAVNIVVVAMTAFNGKLREKAINVAIAICEFEDELKATDQPKS